jgi:hypothetical protein
VQRKTGHQIRTIGASIFQTRRPLNTKRIKTPRKQEGERRGGLRRHSRHEQQVSMLFPLPSPHLANKRSQPPFAVARDPSRTLPTAELRKGPKRGNRRLLKHKQQRKTSTRPTREMKHLRK